MFHRFSFSLFLFVVNAAPLVTFIGGNMGIMAVFQNLLTCPPRHHNLTELAHCGPNSA